MSKYRIALDFSGDGQERLEKLKVITGVVGHGEVIRKALQIYEALVDATEADGIAFIQHADGRIERIFE